MVNRKGHARLEIVQKAYHDPIDDAPAVVDPLKENLILGQTAPQFRFGPFAQPVTLIQNYTTQPTTPEGARRLAIIHAWNKQARKWWNQQRTRSGHGPRGRRRTGRRRAGAGRNGHGHFLGFRNVAPVIASECPLPNLNSELLLRLF